MARDTPRLLGCGSSVFMLKYIEMETETEALVAQGQQRLDEDKAFFARFSELFDEDGVLTSDGPQVQELRDALMAEARERAERSNYPKEDEQPQNQPFEVQTRIINAINQANPYAEPVESITKAVHRYGISLERLSTYSLSPYDQLQLLGAAMYAAESRQTKAGDRLARKVRSILRHNMNNFLPKPGDPFDLESDDAGLVLREDVDKHIHNIKQYYQRYHTALTAAGILFRHDMHQAVELFHKNPISSIDDALFFLGGPSEEAQMRVSAVLRSSANTREIEVTADSPFRELSEIERQRRLINLPIVENELHDIFGTDAAMVYKELTPNNDQTTRDLTEPTERLVGDTELADTAEGAADFADYTFIEVTQANGITHVVAENPDPNNACYVLRGDVLEQAGMLLGTTMAWEDVMIYRKETVRQLGAIRFYHGAETDVVAKLRDYMREPASKTLRTLASKWIIEVRSAYDKNIQPTVYNRLPLTIRLMVAAHPAETKELLLRWLGLTEVPEKSSRSFGQIAIHLAEADPVQTELDSLRAEVARLTEANALLQEKLRTVRDAVK